MNKDKQNLVDRRYLRMATIWSENSYSQRLKVGALLVKDLRIISDGYNGTPSGFDNCCEYKQSAFACTQEDCPDWERRNRIRCRHCSKFSVELHTKPEVLHAEANAITKVARSTNSSEGSTLYVTDSPCMECAKLIIQAGITRVVYMRDYRLTEGLDLLRKAGIEVVQITIDDKPADEHSEEASDDFAHCYDSDCLNYTNQECDDCKQCNHRLESPV